MMGAWYFGGRRGQLHFAMHGQDDSFLPIAELTGFAIAAWTTFVCIVFFFLSCITRLGEVAAARRERRLLVGDQAMRRPIVLGMMALVGCSMFGLASGLVYIDMRSMILQVGDHVPRPLAAEHASRIVRDTSRVWMAMAIGPLGAGLLAASCVMALCRVRVLTNPLRALGSKSGPVQTLASPSA